MKPSAENMEKRRVFRSSFAPLVIDIVLILLIGPTIVSIQLHQFETLYYDLLSQRQPMLSWATPALLLLAIGSVILAHRKLTGFPLFCRRLVGFIGVIVSFMSLGILQLIMFGNIPSPRRLDVSEITQMSKNVGFKVCQPFHGQDHPLYFQRGEHRRERLLSALKGMSK